MPVRDTPVRQESVARVHRTHYDISVAVFVHSVLALCFTAFLWFAVRETAGQLTIRSILYFLSAAALLLLVLRLWSGNLCDSGGQPHSK